MCKEKIVVLSITHTDARHWYKTLPAALSAEVSSGSSQAN